MAENYDGQVIIEIRLDNEGFEKDLESVKKSAQETGKVIEKAANPDTKGLDSVKTKWLDVRKTTETVRSSINNLKDAQEKLNRLYKSGSIGEKEYRELKKQISEAQAALKDHSREFNSATKEYERGSAKIQELTKESDRLSVALEKIVQEAYNTHREFYTDADALDQVVDAALGANKEFQRLSERFEKVSDQLDRQTKKVKEAAAAQGDYGEKIEETADNAEEMAKSLDKAKNPIGTLQVAFGNLVAKGITLAISAIKDFIASSVELAAELGPTRSGLRGFLARRPSRILIGGRKHKRNHSACRKGLQRRTLPSLAL